MTLSLSVHRFFGAIAVLLGAIALSPTATAQVGTPLDTLDETRTPTEAVINCVTTAASPEVAWGHRFTYWLSGIAEFDEMGNMKPLSPGPANDWLLTITNSRFPEPSSYPLMVVSATEVEPEFSFPAVSLVEWEQLGQKPSSSYVTAFRYDEAAHGLYLAIRNTQPSGETVRQLFQVVHYLADNLPVLSEVAACFVGPRPQLPLNEPLP
ncbi:MAG: hypothetical protein ACFB8W_01405 [Elainellaceae cyanobacterium]